MKKKNEKVISQNIARHIASNFGLSHAYIEEGVGYTCGSCQTFFPDFSCYKPNFCPECGTLLDWTDEKEFEEIPLDQMTADMTPKKVKKDFKKMAKEIEKFMHRWGNPHMTIIAQIDHVEILQGEMAKPFKVLD